MDAHRTSVTEMSRTSVVGLPNELLLDICDLLAPPCWEWEEDNRAQAYRFLSLRLVRGAISAAYPISERML